MPFLSRPFKLSLRKNVAVSMVLDHLGYLIHLVHEDVGRIQNEIGKVLLRRGYDGNMLYSITCCCLDVCSERIDSPMLCEGSVVQLPQSSPCHPPQSPVWIVLLMSTVTS